MSTDSTMRCHWLFLGAVLLLGAIDVTSSYNVWKLARANGNFAFRLYREVIQGAAGENVFFSPFRSVTQSLYVLQIKCVKIYCVCYIMVASHDMTYQYNITNDSQVSHRNTKTILTW